MGSDVPQFAHLPLILNPDRTKMSKRKSQTAVADYRAQGYIPEAFVNFLALLGWASGTEEEIFSMDELIERFALERVHQGGAVFDKERLEWLNGQWIRKLSDEELVERAAALPASPICARSNRPAPTSACPGLRTLRPLVPMIRERLPTLSAVGPMVDFLFVDELSR